ncbi:3-isopropylmalate dehydratase small subunit [Marinobacter confluentis]|uniref:3-isopropylmalate dehydratase small subunit n=1 Tax=Marinobacter confluentis TaxID=1697557 RepID=A0A4Z1C1U4_9GAMM|nr:3-isopropylmalate dehydratase small subunit [Marinobacter confluentis]TGN40131.1 3-isopropylmalate dehydratase small subunit [Marinobacter confluentis]
MQPFETHTGIVIPFNRSNIDTDAILPKQYLKMLEKTGYGPHLFDDERYLDPGDVDTPVADRRLNPECILNQTPYSQGSILLAQANFGCGSSREHAVWALRDFGIRALLAPSFGDIFFNNCFNNGLLPVILDQELIDELFERCGVEPGFELTVDLQNCEIQGGGSTWPFVVEEGRRQNLLQGFDEIGLTLERSDAIRHYEAGRKIQEPWLFR